MSQAKIQVSGFVTYPIRRTFRYYFNNTEEHYFFAVKAFRNTKVINFVVGGYNKKANKKHVMRFSKCEHTENGCNEDVAKFNIEMKENVYIDFKMELSAGEVILDGTAINPEEVFNLVPYSSGFFDSKSIRDGHKIVYGSIPPLDLENFGSETYDFGVLQIYHNAVNNTLGAFYIDYRSFLTPSYKGNSLIITPKNLLKSISLVKGEKLVFTSEKNSCAATVKCPDEPEIECELANEYTQFGDNLKELFASDNKICRLQTYKNLTRLDSNKYQTFVKTSHGKCGKVNFTFAEVGRFAQAGSFSGMTLDSSFYKASFLVYSLMAAFLICTVFYKKQRG